METRSERISIPVPGASKDMAVYVARPHDDSTVPGILLFMEIFGINSHIRSVVDRVAAEGYVVMAPDLFHRTAPGVELGYGEADLETGIGYMSATKPEEILADVKATADALQARSDVAGSGIGAMGFCFGGHVAYRMACELPIKATASFYGGGVAAPSEPGDPPSTIERTAGITGKILCLFGENDTYIPASDVAIVRKELDAHNISHEVVVYPGVGHGFFCDVRGDYDAGSAADAWQRVTKLFKNELS